MDRTQAARPSFVVEALRTPSGPKIEVTECGRYIRLDGKKYAVKARNLDTTDPEAIKKLVEMVTKRLRKGDLVLKSAEESSQERRIPVTFKTPEVQKKFNAKVEKVHKRAQLSSRVSEGLRKEKQSFTAANVAKVGGAILFGPLMLALGLALAPLVYIGQKLSDLYNVEFNKYSLVKANRSMKADEEQAKLNAAVQYPKNISEGVYSVDGITRYLQNPVNKVALIQTNIERSILSQLALKGEKIDNNKKREVHAFVQRLDLDARNITSPWKGKISDQELRTIMTEGSQALDQVDEAAIQEFHDAFSRFYDALNPSPDQDPLEANQKIIAEFRNVLNTKVYQALKQDPSHQAIKFLHGFAASMWNQVKAMDAYTGFGKSVITTMKKTDSSIQSKPIVEQLEESVVAVHKELLTDHGAGKYVYAVTHPKQALGSMASGGGVLRFIASLFGRGVYDSHRTLSNNPSHQGERKGKIRGKDVQIDNVYGGSPTIGDDLIAPEYLAVIQAAENNQFAKAEDRNRDVPDTVLYTNFQDLGKSGGEGPRSVTIMELNRRYPLSFKGITLSKDSEFYLMKQRSAITWTNAKSFGEEMYRNLKDHSSFTLEGRTKGSANQGSGFYFPGDRETWKKDFKNIIASADELFADMTANTAEEIYELRGAYQEYVYASLQDLLETELAVEMIGRGIENPRVQAQRACKENIDRGGVANVLYLYLHLPQTMLEEKKMEIMIGALHSRALAARDRMVLKNRLPQVFAMIKRIDPQVFAAKQKAILQKSGIAWDGEGPIFTPALANII